MLALADLAEADEDAVKAHLAEEYSGTREGGSHSNGVTDLNAIAAVTEWLSDADILIAYESVGSWGCDSSSWFLIRKAGALFEVSGSHCSCYGFQGQWAPAATSIAYLTSEKFYLSVGGYDDDNEANREAVKAEVAALAARLPADVPA